MQQGENAGGAGFSHRTSTGLFSDSKWFLWAVMLKSASDVWQGRKRWKRPFYPWTEVEVLYVFFTQFFREYRAGKPCVSAYRQAYYKNGGCCFSLPDDLCAPWIWSGFHADGGSNHRHYLYAALCEGCRKVCSWQAYRIADRYGMVAAVSGGADECPVSQFQQGYSVFCCNPHFWHQCGGTRCYSGKYYPSSAPEEQRPGFLCTRKRSCAGPVFPDSSGCTCPAELSV